MNISLIILIILLTVLGNGYYIVTIFRGQTKPHIFSWIIWAIVQLTACAIQLQHGSNWWALTLWLNGVICVLVSVLAIWYGERHITLLDKISFFLALGILPIWLWAKQDFTAILLAVTIDVLSYVPTARKSFRKPHGESLWTYYASSAAFFISILLTQEKTIITLLYPIIIFCINFVFIGYVFWRRKIIKK